MGSGELTPAPQVRAGGGGREQMPLPPANRQSRGNGGPNRSLPGSPIPMQEPLTVAFALGCLFLVMLPLILSSKKEGPRQGGRAMEPEPHAADGKAASQGSGAHARYNALRSEVYDAMAEEFEHKGPAFLDHGDTSQSLKLTDLFRIKDGTITPILKPAVPPVRANVLHMDTRTSREIAQVVRAVLEANFTGGVWYQKEDMYHMSMLHASHHVTSVSATPAQIEEEAKAVEAVCRRACPLEVYMDRVVLTATGVLVGCWQVFGGTDPAQIRDWLTEALPGAPHKQLYNKVMLHTSFARILGPPNLPQGGKTTSPEDSKRVLDALVKELNHRLHGKEAVVKELLYVEEFDLLALALNGRIKPQSFTLSCSSELAETP